MVVRKVLEHNYCEIQDRPYNYFSSCLTLGSIFSKIYVTVVHSIFSIKNSCNVTTSRHHLRLMVEYNTRKLVEQQGSNHTCTQYVCSLWAHYDIYNVSSSHEPQTIYVSFIIWYTKHAVHDNKFVASIRTCIITINKLSYASEKFFFHFS